MEKLTITELRYIGSALAEVKESYEPEDDGYYSLFGDKISPEELDALEEKIERLTQEAESEERQERVNSYDEKILKVLSEIETTANNIHLLAFEHPTQNRFEGIKFRQALIRLEVSDKITKRKEGRKVIYFLTNKA